MKKQVVLHNHVKSEFDAVPHLSDFFQRLEEIGAGTVAITDHGSLAGIQDAYDYIEKHNCDIKIIYGVEAYVEHPLFDINEKTSHLILMAVNDKGKQTIDKLVSMAELNSKNQPVIKRKHLLKQLSLCKGDVIVTSACIASEFGLTLQSNDIYDSMIEKVEKKQNECIRPDDEQFLKAKEELKNQDELIFSLREERNRLLKIARRAFTAKEKKLEKLMEIDDAQAKKFKENLDKEKAESLAARTQTEELLIKISSAKRYRTQINDSVKDLSKSVDKWKQYASEIDAVKNRKSAKEDLVSLAENFVLEYVSAIGKENFYIEVQNHGLEIESFIYPILADIARKHELKIVAANDAHMPINDEYNLQRRKIARFLRYVKISEDSDADKELYVKTNDELRIWLSKILPEDIVDEAIENTYEIGERCNYVPPIKPSHYPVFDKTKDSKVLLVELANRNITKRFPNKTGWTEVYQKRLNYELDVICNMGYADYHLIVADFLEYGRILGLVPIEEINNAPLSIPEAKAWVEKNGWTVGIGCGIGRGSGAGSLVCFLLGITDIDPIKYGLLFERFLNPERVTMPDIDSDFRIETRDKVIEYVQNKYGYRAVCNILTENTEGVKGAIRDAARFYGKELLDDDKAFLDLGNAMRKKVPDALNITFDTIVANEISCMDSLKIDFSNNPDALKILEYAYCIEGMITSYGMHAAGVVISDNTDVTDYIPLRWNSKKERYTTQCNMVQVEELGLLKMDFLGLRNLSIITETLKMILKNHGIAINIKDILNNPLEVFTVIREIYAKGRTKDVFQFESAGMRSNLKKLQPTSIEDIVAMNALYRPGPMDFIPDYIKGKHNPESIEYDCPQLEPILAPTYGCIVYQEQVMQIVRDLAGYTLGRSDLVRRAMSKKKEAVMEQERKNFVYGNIEEGIPGCIANGIDEAVANKIYDNMIDFAKYAFNKSHAVAYAVTSFFTAWLKYYYPAEYLCNVLRLTEKIEDYVKVIEDAKEFGIEVLPPDINKSSDNFTVVDGKILFGLSAVKNVGDSALSIFERRKEEPFKNIYDFILRGHVKSDSTFSLIRSGCFDSLGYTRASLDSTATLELIKIAQEIHKKEKFISAAKEVTSFVEEIHSLETFKEMIQKRNLQAFTFNGKKVPTKEAIQKRIRTAQNKISELLEDFYDTDIEFIESDIDTDLAKEKELLGVYLTGHPMDKYSSSFEVTKKISDVEKTDNSIRGIVSNLVIRKDKKNQDWATFILEDQSGNMNCIMFSSQFSVYKDFLKEDMPVEIKGEIQTDNFHSTEEEEVLQMVANNVSRLETCAACAVLTTGTPFDWLDVMPAVQQYKDENGIPLRVIFTLLNGQLYKCGFKVSKEIAKYPNVQIKR